MYAGEDADDGRTAFRRAEKRYKLHREQTFRRRRGRLKSAGFSTRAVDLSDVLDLARVRAREATDPAVRRVDVDVGDATRPDVVETYRLETHPGLVLVPGALTVPEQRRWLKAAVTTLCEPPARTNHAAAHGAFADLWTQACRPDARALEPPPNDPADRPHPGALRGWVTLDPPPRAAIPVASFSRRRSFDGSDGPPSARPTTGPRACTNTTRPTTFHPNRSARRVADSPPPPA